MLKKVFIPLMLLLQLSLFADTSQGETLEKQMWQYTKDHKWNDLANMIAPYFQCAIFDNIQDKDTYLARAKVLNIGDYVLSNFKVTESPGILIVTYEIAVSETIEGKQLSSKANRLSVWQQTDNKWLCIAHAVLIPVPSKKS